MLLPWPQAKLIQSLLRELPEEDPRRRIADNVKTIDSFQVRMHRSEFWPLLLTSLNNIHGNQAFVLAFTHSLTGWRVRHHRGFVCEEPT
jgi:hypothetical protein